MNLMSSTDYCESIRRYSPSVYVHGSKVDSVADEPLLAPGVNAVALTYDFALVTFLKKTLERTCTFANLGYPELSNA